MKKFKRQSGNRGTAALEFVVTIPFLALLIAGVFFLGWVVRSENRLLRGARYGAWRNIANSQAETDATKEAWTLYGEPDEADMREEFIDTYTQNNKRVVTTDFLNERFYGSQAESSTMAADSGSNAILEDYVNDAYEYHIDCGNLAEASVFERFPYGSGFTVSAEFDHDKDAWYRFTSGETSMSRRQFCDGIYWRRYQVSYLEAVRDIFLEGFDSHVSTVEPSQLQTNIRNLYLQDW